MVHVGAFKEELKKKQFGKQYPCKPLDEYSIYVRICFGASALNSSLHKMISGFSVIAYKVCFYYRTDFLASVTQIVPGKWWCMQLYNNRKVDVFLVSRPNTLNEEQNCSILYYVQLSLSVNRAKSVSNVPPESLFNGLCSSMT
jgi:hypothetical protein